MDEMDEILLDWEEMEYEDFMEKYRSHDLYDEMYSDIVEDDEFWYLD